MKEPVFENKSVKVFTSVWEKRDTLFQFPHELIFPKNTFSPWRESEFESLYEVIANTHTLVDIYRCYELFSIAKDMIHKAGDILEVGVWRGGTAFLMAKASSPETTVFLCDTFEGVVKASAKDNLYKGGEHADTSEDMVNKLMSEHHIENYQILKGIFPENTASTIQDRTFKLCHIDVDVYESAKDIFEWVWPKLIVGGVVIFDDYGFAACEGVTDYVNNLRHDLPDHFFTYNINGHALFVKTS